jgi:RHS repeat-associated protein
MIEAGLTQSRRAAKVGFEPDPAGLRVFVPSCESVFHDHDSARSGDIGDDQETWLQTTVTGPGTLTFDYKLSCDAGDEYAFYIDDQYKAGRAGSKDWTESPPWTITGAGTHTIRWKFIKDSSGSSGSDCLWIDRIRWTGAMPDGEGWDRIEYAYDAAGRRIEKKVDGATQVKFVYDGDHILAEYNNAGTLLRKYVHGAGIDRPICMIESSGTYAGTHYYHYDALGSVVAMTNSSGTVVQLYEYSVYGQVAASDADHPNRFMFTGREFDKDTGLYYYRARYYHPEIGRFLQTDPVGYDAGLNLHGYCGNNPIIRIDPFGRDWFDDPYWDEGEEVTYTVKSTQYFADLLGWYGCGMPAKFVMREILGMDPKDDWGDGKDIRIELVYSFGVSLIKINGVHLLMDGELDSILKRGDEKLNTVVSFHEVNQWDIEGGWPFTPGWLDKLLSVRTPFQVIEKLKSGTFLYFQGYDSWGRAKGGKYGGSQINYIGAGHAAAKLYVPREVMLWGVRIYNRINNHNWGSREELFWALKGYNEFLKRRDW